MNEWIRRGMRLWVLLLVVLLGVGCACVCQGGGEEGRRDEETEGHHRRVDTARNAEIKDGEEEWAALDEGKQAVQLRWRQRVMKRMARYRGTTELEMSATRNSAETAMDRSSGKKGDGVSLNVEEVKSRGESRSSEEGAPLNVEKEGAPPKIEQKGSPLLNVEENYGRRRRGRRSRVAYEARVYAGEGQFLTVMQIGTPPVSFTAIFDTGSDLVWRQCEPCKQCYPQTDYGFPIFDPAHSSTFHKAACANPLCPAAQIYGGSCSAPPNSTCSYNSLYDDPPAFTRGDLAFDTLTLSDPSGHLHRIPHFAFGCSHESHGPYNFAGSGGIVGFGEGQLALPSQLAITKFSYCLPKLSVWSIHPSELHQQTPMANSSSLSSSLSTPVLLGDAARLSGKGIQSTRIVGQGYIVDLLGISVAGHRLNISTSLLVNGGTLIDSGTTFTTLPIVAFHSLYAAFRRHIPQKPWYPHGGAGPRNLSLCYTSLPSPLPSLAFHFRGASLRLQPHNYFVFINGLYCLAILETRDTRTVYGNVQQQDFHILYDLRARLISFKPTSCASLQHT